MEREPKYGKKTKDCYHCWETRARPNCSSCVNATVYARDDEGLWNGTVDNGIRLLEDGKRI